MRYPKSERLGHVVDPNGEFYSLHFRGEEDGCAVILGPMPLARRMASLPEVHREPASDPVDARIKLSAWCVPRGWVKA